jgi:hypothetical protein
LQHYRFSKLLNLASPAFAEQAFLFFTVGNIGLLSYGHISESGLEQLNEAYLRRPAICALGPVPLRDNRQ